jgi:Spy/CpxP family protein refolding chaperone
MIALLIPAGYAFGQMRWHDQSGEDVVIFQGKGTRCDSPGMGRGIGRGMGRGMKGHGMGPHGIMAMADELELSDDQIDKLQTMATQFRLEKVDKDAALKKARISLQALMRDDAGESQVFAAMDEVSRLETDLHKTQYRHHQQMKGLLTDEQQKKLKELRCDGSGFQGMGKPGGRGMRQRIIELDTDG